MLENFKRYLIEQGYTEETPSGNPSTVYDYPKRIQKICERESITLTQLSDNINQYVQKYGDFGTEVEFGNKSHRAYINALRRFEEFTNF